MATRPPGPKNKTYRGRLRSQMRSAVNHMERLYKYDVRYRGGPMDAYPNQLAPLAQVNTLTDAITVVVAWLEQLGPIPSR